MSVRSSSLRGRPIVALCGGVGGAKLALGLERLVGADLAVIVNTGDDFEHLGLHVSPDIDTVLYTLGGLSDVERGWGRADETWNFMESLGGLGGETWFRLGDRDLAMHVERTRALRGGTSLTDFTTAMARRLGIASRILPMSDDRVETMVITADGPLPFQRYFIGLQCAPVVKRLEFKNAERAAASDQVMVALKNPNLAAVIVCPSNPYLSVDSHTGRFGYPQGPRSRNRAHCRNLSFDRWTGGEGADGKDHGGTRCAGGFRRDRPALSLHRRVDH